MNLTVLGRYAPFPAAGGACSGYLLEHGGKRVLVDCGSGVLAKLQATMPLREVTDVVLSHLHGDHTSDLMVLRYAADADLRHSHRPSGIDVYAPKAPEDEFSRLAYKEALIPHGVDDGDSLALGGMLFEFTAVDHPFPCFSVRVSAGGRVFAFSGDTAWCPQILEVARGADVFLCEASLFDEDASGGYRGHLSARQAGEIAREAGVGRLLLTHLWPFHDFSRLVAEASSAFGGETSVAEEGGTYPI
ncbi:MAG: MBL fold metallo-hydrolase [Ignavibacteriales bacterium]